jgi:hypothetical protein
MAIGVVRPKDPSEHQASHAPNDTTPPTQDHEKRMNMKLNKKNLKIKIKFMIKRKALIKGEDEDDGDHEGSRTRPP